MTRVANALQNAGVISFPAPAAELEPPTGWALSRNTDDFVMYGPMGSAAGNIGAGNSYTFPAGSIGMSFA